MKHLTLLILLALAPLSWAEDVYYCVEELSYKIGKDDSDESYKLMKYREEKFTFKYELDSHKLMFKGKTFAGDSLYPMGCFTCLPGQSYFTAEDSVFRFQLDGDRFFMAGVSSQMSEMQTGTCTKF